MSLREVNTEIPLSLGVAKLKCLPRASNQNSLEYINGNVANFLVNSLQREHTTCCSG